MKPVDLGTVRAGSRVPDGSRAGGAQYVVERRQVTHQCVGGVQFLGLTPCLELRHGRFRGRHLSHPRTQRFQAGLVGQVGSVANAFDPVHRQAQ
jgi:hypothetical protein